MASVNYMKACKAGKKEYQSRLAQGKLPTLAVLDDILPPKGSYTEVPLGLVQIPTDRIVGTKTGGRSNAFAANFMPILNENSEFAQKWAALCASHEMEGIHEPVKAYEYYNQFYILEGNKRASVMKFFKSPSIPGTVTRIIPPKDDTPENQIYYEFLDFYEASKINLIWFSKKGGFPALVKAMGKKPEEPWTEDERLDFRSAYSRFLSEYKSRGGDKLHITGGDAFLSFISLYNYESLKEMSTPDLKKHVASCWEEFLLLDGDASVDLKLDPSTGKKPLWNHLLPAAPSHLKVAFVYEKTTGTSSWTYAHELGRMLLEQTFPDEVSTICYENTTLENIDSVLEDAVEKKCDLIFTTTPPFATASVKAATFHPDVRILNCSLGTAHRYIRTYYARMYEAKFLMGVIAGSMASNGRLAYIADYPIYGTIANINAFALGAKLVNPRAKVYLEWDSEKDIDMEEHIRKHEADCVAARDMVIPEKPSPYFGLYRTSDSYPRNLAMPLWHWGRMYEKLIRQIMDGTWKYDDPSKNTKAINYWWGMPSGVVDIILSSNIPIGTRRLIRLLKKNICDGSFHPFAGVLYSQSGPVQTDPDGCLTPEAIATMDWLAENIIGAVPQKEHLKEDAAPVVSQQGIQPLKQ